MNDRNSAALRGIVAAAVLFTLLPAIAFAISAFAPDAAAGSASGAEAGAAGAGSGETTISALAAAIVSPSTFAALRFSLEQASASTLLAALIGLPGAYFVATYRFRGRRLFLSLAAVPFCLPSILVILAFILYYGKNGWFTLALARLGLPLGDSSLLYSFWGLVFVHAFYNFPLFVQNVGAVWAKMPRSREEAARTLGAGRLRAFASGTLPYLGPSILQSASLVFLFCFFSFTIVLVFGGLAGTTLEVGIYRAVRFTNDRPKALALAIVQTAVALLAVGAFARFDGRSAAAARGFGSAAPLKRPGRGAAAGIAAYQALVAVFFIGPLFALAAEAFSVRASLGGRERFGLDNFARLLSNGGPLASAALNSLAISGAAALAATALGAAIASVSHYGADRRPTRFIGALTIVPLAMSPALVASGWGALLDSGGALLIVAGQLSISWPFVARSLQAAFRALDRSRNEAARTLGASPAYAFMRVDAAAMAPSVASAAAFAFSITMGDANIPLLVGGGRYETLPLLLFRLTSSYRFNEACAVGIVLALFTSVAFFLKERTNELS